MKKLEKLVALPENCCAVKKSGGIRHSCSMRVLYLRYALEFLQHIFNKCKELARQLQPFTLLSFPIMSNTIHRLGKTN